MPVFCFKVDAIPKCSAILHAQWGMVVHCFKNLLLCRYDLDTFLASVMTNKSLKFSSPFSFSTKFQINYNISFCCFLLNHIIPKTMICSTHVHYDLTIQITGFQSLSSLKFSFKINFIMSLCDLENGSIFPEMEDWTTSDPPSSLASSPWLLKLICPLF